MPICHSGWINIFTMVIGLMAWTDGSESAELASKRCTGTEIDQDSIRHSGLTARANPERRNDAVQELAGWIKLLAGKDKVRLRSLQGAFQEALLLACDHAVYQTLTPATVRAVDEALETAFTLKEIGLSNDWNPLAYVYGFFNRDVTPEEIESVREGWLAIPEDEREPSYPTYVHLIDAVCKPLSMGPLSNAVETSRALAIAIPLLKSMLEQQPKPGRAFHVPTHAALTLAPLYDMWSKSEEFGPIIREFLGDRHQFVRLFTAQLVGNRSDRMYLSKADTNFYFYSGRYLANALARFGASEALPALRASMEVYRSKSAPQSTIHYTQRALIALGDQDARREFEDSIHRDADKQEEMKTAVWLCRNGQGETVEYGRRKLAEMLDCESKVSLEIYFKKRLTDFTQHRSRSKDGTP